MDGTTRLYKNIDAITLSSKSKQYLLIDEWQHAFPQLKFTSVIK
jgi:hypothetical protein